MSDGVLRALVDSASPDELAHLARALQPVLQRPSIDPDRLYTAKEAAVYLRCRPPRIYDLIRAGELVPERSGRTVLLRRHELDRHLAAGSDP